MHGPQADLNANGLRGQFESFYEAFFKNGLPQHEVDFLHRAFVDFGKHHWKQASIHPRFNQENNSNIVGIYGLAKVFGIHPRTARSMVSKGTIPVYSHNRNTDRMLFDLSDEPLFEFAQGKSLSLESAAAILDIPAAVLRTYRANGHYIPRYPASPIVLYHERDVEDLRNALMKDCPLIKADNNPCQISLRKVMLKKLGASEVKAAFIDAVRLRRIKPIGRLGDKPGDLVFNPNEVKDILDAELAKLADSVSLEDTQDALGLDQATMKMLIKNGHLRSIQNDYGYRIALNSVSEILNSIIPKAA